MKYYEIRDPILGFIAVNEWEREIIDHWAFQRLRRIKQLAWTDMVYPGATHSRFEHSLGVMHIATQMFDSIVNKNAEFLKSELNFTEAGFQRDRVLVRLAGLLHDVAGTNSAERIFMFCRKKAKRTPGKRNFSQQFRALFMA